MSHTGLFDTLRQDFRYASRQLRKNPGFALFAIATLAIGLGSATAAFSILDQWLIRPLALKNARELQHLWRTSAADHTQPLFFFQYREYLKFAKESRSFSSMSATFYRGYTLTGHGKPEGVMGEITTVNLFDTLGVRAALGRTFLPRDRNGEKSVIMSHAFWTEKFGASRSIIGQTIRLNDELYRVIGVLPQNFSYRILDQPVDAALWAVIQENDRIYQADSFAAVAVLGRLKPGVTRAQAQSELNVIQQRMDRQWKVPEGMAGTATLVSGLQEDNARGVRFSLLVLGCAAAFLLLIACANSCALVLSRNATRHSEFAMRIALGSGAGRLFQQLLTENLLLYGAAVLIGFAGAAAVVRGFDAWNPIAILPPGGIALDYRACAGAAAAALVASMFFGTLPAFLGSRTELQHALRRMGRSQSLDTQRVHALSWITGAQMALTLVFLTGAGLLFSTLVNLERQNYGFESARVSALELNLPSARYSRTSDAIGFEERLIERLREQPGIASAALGPDVTEGDIFLDSFAVSDRAATANSNLHAGQIPVSAQYFETLRIPVLQGSDFPRTVTPDSEPLAIVNEAVARRYFPNENPIGKHIRFGVPSDPQTAKNRWYRIIGIVGDIRSIAYNKTIWKTDPLVYLDFQQEKDAPIGVTNWNGRRCSFLIAGTSGAPLTLTKVQTVIASLDPELPIDRFDPLDKRVMAHLAQPKMRAEVLSGFSGISLLLASIGLYGVLSQAVAQRRREIAIRLAVGADRKDVIGLVLRRSLAITAAGVFCGTVIAFAGAKAVHSVVYGISPLNPLLYAAAACVLFAVSLMAAFMPARRAAAVDPATNLRTE
jgi:predicted permease